MNCLVKCRQVIDQKEIKLASKRMLKVLIRQLRKVKQDRHIGENSLWNAYE